jgi:hypothetical protein
VKSWLRRVRPLLVALVGVATIVACDETLESGAACPALCPGTAQQVIDTTFTAVTLDTSLVGYPQIGTELKLMLATLADTFDARGIVRFDSLPTDYFAKAGGDSLIRSADSANITITLADLDTLRTDSVTFEAYDVGEAANDTASADLTAEFTPANLLGSATVLFSDSAMRKDSTVVIPIDSAKLNARIHMDTATAGAPRLRVGIRATSASPVLVHMMTGNTAPEVVARLSFLPDSGENRLVETANSSKPAEDPQLRADLADFQLVSIAPPPPAGDVVRMGGVPGWRTMIRFAIPSSIIDSSSLVRATLELVQSPNPAMAQAGDSVYFRAYVLTAAPVISDVARQLTFIAPVGDSIKRAPRDSGVVEIEVVRIMRGWRLTDTTRTPRVIIFGGLSEGLKPGVLEFYSREAAPTVRPRLHLSYIPAPPRSLP